jgi:hypothetical protein
MQLLLGGLPRCVKTLTFDGCLPGRAASGQFRRGRPEWDLSYESEVGGDLTPSDRGQSGYEKLH